MAQKPDRFDERDASYKFSELKCALEGLTKKDRIAPLVAMTGEQQKELLKLLAELDKQHQTVENSLNKLSQDKDVNIPLGGCSTEPPREQEQPQGIPLPELRKAAGEALARNADRVRQNGQHGSEAVRV